MVVRRPEGDAGSVRRLSAVKNPIRAQVLVEESCLTSVVALVVLFASVLGVIWAVVA